jgi:hypothetical protein
MSTNGVAWKVNRMHWQVKSWADGLIQRVVEREPFDINYHEISIAGLSDGFEGFTIAQISDLHIDRWNTPVVEAAVDAVNRLKADLVVCTGDVIAHGPEYLGDVTHLLRQFEGRVGKLACLGNHDYSDHSGSHGVRDALHRGGFDVLINESTELTAHGKKLQLAGADDLILGRQCLKATSRKLIEHVPTVLLSHNPENFKAMARFQPDLILSGHTHGGQIKVPAAIHRRLMGSPYVAGLYRQMQSKLYVNRGLGAAVFVEHWDNFMGRSWRMSIPTPRWWVRPEISVFRLTRPVLSGETPFEPAVKLAS